MKVKHIEQKTGFKITFCGLLLLVSGIISGQTKTDLQDIGSTSQKSTSDLIAECKQLEDQDPTAAIKLANDLLPKLAPQKDAINYGHVLGCMGWAYVTLNNLTEARAKALDIEQLVAGLDAASIDSIQLVRRAGGIFHRIGDRVSASENYYQAMQQAENLQAVTEQIPILVNLGVLNSELREHEQAIENYYQALKLMAEIEDFRYRPPVLFNLATTLNGQGRYNEGLRVFQQVEDMINDQWPPGRVSQTYHGLAAAHSALKNLPLAKEYAEKALKILADNDQINSSYYNAKTILAGIYSQQGATQLATEYANEASQYFMNPDNKSDVLGSTNPLPSLAITYERLGLLKQAIEMHKAANKIDNEMQDTFNQEVMAQMQVRLNDSQEREEMALIKSQRINDQIKLREADYERKLLLLMSAAAIVLFVWFLIWQRLTNNKLRTMAMTDTLTQLGNRRAITDWLETHKLPSEPGCRFLWLIDLDKFKQVNDEYDHDVGDFVLQKIANSLMSLNNRNRVVGRWGGEEFIIITDDVAAEQKDDFSKVLLNTVKQTEIQSGSVSLSITASVGISCIENSSSSAWTRALYQADKALYSAKSRGRDCVVLATSNNQSK